MLRLCLEWTVHCISANGGKLRARKRQCRWCNALSERCHTEMCASQKKVPLFSTPSAAKFRGVVGRFSDLLSPRLAQCHYPCRGFSDMDYKGHTLCPNLEIKLNLVLWFVAALMPCLGHVEDYFNFTYCLPAWQYRWTWTGLSCPMVPERDTGAAHCFFARWVK